MSEQSLVFTERDVPKTVGKPYLRFLPRSTSHVWPGSTANAPASTIKPRDLAEHVAVDQHLELYKGCQIDIPDRGFFSFDPGSTRTRVTGACHGTKLAPVMFPKCFRLKKGPPPPLLTLFGAPGPKVQIWRQLALQEVLAAFALSTCSGLELSAEMQLAQSSAPFRNG